MNRSLSFCTGCMVLHFEQVSVT